MGWKEMGVSGEQKGDRALGGGVSGTEPRRARHG